MGENAIVVHGIFPFFSFFRCTIAPKPFDVIQAHHIHIEQHCEQTNRQQQQQKRRALIRFDNHSPFSTML